MSTRDEFTDAEWLMRQIDCLACDEAMKERFRSLLRSLAGQRIHLSRRALVMPARVKRAADLLESGRTVAQVREALIGLGVKRRTAYYIISQALALRTRPTGEAPPQRLETEDV